MASKCRHLTGERKMGEKLESTLGCGFAILFFGFGLLQLAAGWAGIEHSFGWGWGVAAAIAALFFRFTLPIAVGAFLCAKRSEEHTSELQSLMRISYAVFCLKKKKKTNTHTT